MRDLPCERTRIRAAQQHGARSGGAAGARGGEHHAAHGALIVVDGLVDLAKRLRQVVRRRIVIRAVAARRQRLQRAAVHIAAHSHDVDGDARLLGQRDDVVQAVVAAVLLAIGKRDDHARARFQVRALQRPVQCVEKRRLAGGRNRIDGAVEQRRARGERLAIVHVIVERGDLSHVALGFHHLVYERACRLLGAIHLAARPHGTALVDHQVDVHGVAHGKRDHLLHRCRILRTGRIGFRDGELRRIKAAWRGTRLVGDLRI